MYVHTLYMYMYTQLADAQAPTCIYLSSFSLSYFLFFSLFLPSLPLLLLLLTPIRIQFPDPQSRYHGNHVVVTGSVDDVFKAREQLLVSVVSCGHVIIT